MVYFFRGARWEVGERPGDGLPGPQSDTWTTRGDFRNEVEMPGPHPVFAPARLGGSSHPGGGMFSENFESSDFLGFKSR